MEQIDCDVISVNSANLSVPGPFEGLFSQMKTSLGDPPAPIRFEIDLHN